MSQDEPQESPHDVLAAEEFVVPAADPRLSDRATQDVLAAEEFVVPAADPRLSDREAHDILAAEEFAMPSADPALRIAGAPMPLPTDPNDPGDRRPPHDILAAEEFALPAPEPRATPTGVSDSRPPGRGRGVPRIAAVLAGGLVLLLRRRLRHRA